MAEQPTLDGIVPPGAIRTASISDCGVYRWELCEFPADASRLALWAMLNPSTADADVDDPTVRRVRSFTAREGFDGFVIVNLYAYRATEPIELTRVDPTVVEGAENLKTVGRWLFDPRVATVICAWGGYGAHRGLPESKARRALETARSTLPLPVQCFALTTNGQPVHPLYLPGRSKLVAWE